jgi:hypothetical protein
MPKVLTVRTVLLDPRDTVALDRLHVAEDEAAQVGIPEHAIGGARPAFGEPAVELLAGAVDAAGPCVCAPSRNPLTDSNR